MIAPDLRCDGDALGRFRNLTLAAVRASTLSVLVLPLVLTLSACRGREHAGDGPYAEKVANVVPQIEEAMGVKFKTPPKLEVRSRDQVREFLVAEFDKQDPQQELAGEESAYKALGLIPDTMDLRKFLVNLLTEQVIGYYDPATKVLYIIEGAPEDIVGITITHELVHALQDQYFSLDSIQRIKGDDDRQVAAQSVIEGQATYQQMAIMLGKGNIVASLPGGWNRIRDIIRESQEAQPIFGAAPLMIQESLLFPYINGAEFVRRFAQHFPDSLPFGQLPVSTEQVMHEDAYFGTPPDVPTKIDFPKLPNETYRNDLGEFGTRLFLYEHLRNQDAAVRGAAGWDGDRLVLVSTPSGNSVVWVSVWDSPIEAAEFVTILGSAVQRRYRGAAPEARADGVRTFSGAGRTVRITAREIDGRNTVLYVDAPAGQSATLLDMSRITLDR